MVREVAEVDGMEVAGIGVVEAVEAVRGFAGSVEVGHNLAVAVAVLVTGALL